MATLKLSKYFWMIFFLSLLVSIIVFTIYSLKNSSENFNEKQACEESIYITSGKRTFIVFTGNNINFESGSFSILALKAKKTIRYSEINPKNINDKILYFDDKILKTDTLLIKVNNNEIRIYDFRNDGWYQKAGKDKGKFNCYIYMKINAVEYCLESDTIYLSKKDIYK